MRFDLERLIRAAQQRLHRSVGQHWFHAKKLLRVRVAEIEDEMMRRLG